MRIETSVPGDELEDTPTKHGAALVGANPGLWRGLHWGCIGSVWGLYGGWRVPMVQMEPGMGQWGREGGDESQKAVKLEDETKKAMRMCPGPQSGSRTASRPVRTTVSSGCRAWGHSPAGSMLHQRQIQRLAGPWQEPGKNLLVSGSKCGDTSYPQC